MSGRQAWLLTGPEDSGPEAEQCGMWHRMMLAELGACLASALFASSVLEYTWTTSTNKGTRSIWTI